MEVKGKIIILCQCCWPRSKSIPAYFHPMYVLTTGYRRLASIISPETQSPSKGQLQQKSTPPCFCHFDSSPVCKGWRHSLKAKHSKLLEMTLSVPLLTLTSAFYKGRWNRHERKAEELFFLKLHLISMRLIWSRENTETKQDKAFKSVAELENGRKRGKNKLSFSLHPLRCQKYLRLSFLPWQGDGQ